MSLPPLPDDDWIEALRGRPSAGTDPRTRDEAARIRAALRTASHTEGMPEDGLDALLFRLRREGLLGAVPHRPRRPLWFALAATLAVAAIALPLTLGLLRDATPPDAPSLTRGLPVPAQRVQATDPVAAAQALATALREAGAGVEIISDTSHPRLRVEIPDNRRAACAEVLSRAGLVLPPPGQPLRVEFRSPPSTP